MPDQAIKGGADLYKTVAYDKGKPAVRQGRKAVSLFWHYLAKGDCLVAEGNWKEPELQNSSTALAVEVLLQKA